MMTRSWFLAMLITGGVLVVMTLDACQPLPPIVVPTGQPAAPTQAPGPAAQTGAPTEAGQPPSGGETIQLNLEEIFPSGEGRDLVLRNCANCHSLGPIVVSQMSRGQWEVNARNHKDRLRSLGDKEFETLYEYLIANFNPDRPVPAIPKSLLVNWPAYQ